MSSRARRVEALLLGAALLGACSRNPPERRAGPETQAPPLATSAVATNAAGPAMARATLTFDGMFCEGCAHAARAALAKVPGVRWASVDFQHRTATVVYDPQRTSVAALAGTLEHIDRSPAPPFHVTARGVERLGR